MKCTHVAFSNHEKRCREEWKNDNFDHIKVIVCVNAPEKDEFSNGAPVFQNYSGAC